MKTTPSSTADLVFDTCTDKLKDQLLEMEEEELFLTFKSYMELILFTGENKPHRHHIGSTTLSFNLSSKKAFDEGWVVKNTQEPAIDQGNVLEWATSRLKTLIKQK